MKRAIGARLSSRGDPALPTDALARLPPRGEPSAGEEYTLHRVLLVIPCALVALTAGCSLGGSHAAARRPNATPTVLATMAANIAPPTPAPPSPTPSPSPSPTPSPTPAAVTVQMANNVFIPTTITVPAGTTVTWVNDEDPNALDNIHDVMADDYTSWSSAYLNPGESYAHTFTAPGTYHYLCDLHSRMEGTVVVQ